MPQYNVRERDEDSFSRKSGYYWVFFDRSFQNFLGSVMFVCTCSHEYESTHTKESNEAAV